MRCAPLWFEWQAPISLVWVCLQNLSQADRKQELETVLLEAATSLENQLGRIYSASSAHTQPLCHCEVFGFCLPWWRQKLLCFRVQVQCRACIALCSSSVQVITPVFHEHVLSKQCKIAGTFGDASCKRIHSHASVYLPAGTQDSSAKARSERDYDRTLAKLKKLQKSA